VTEPVPPTISGAAPGDPRADGARPDTTPREDVAHNGAPVSGTTTPAVVRDGLEVRTEPFGGSPLARAVLATGVPAHWYAPVPAGAGAWRAHADALLHQFSAGAWLELLAPALDARGAAAARLATVAGGAGLVVTTGQQPGLFGGPLYTLSKALSARALADALQAATGVPVAPIFWAATDDTDFAEASRTYIAGRDGLSELAIHTDADEGTPMSAVAIGAEIDRLGGQLAGAAGALAYAPALHTARAAYQAGETVGGAYVALMRALLEPLGIAVLDASHAAVREGGFQLLRRALLVSAIVEEAVQARSAEIAAAGFTPQVAEVPGRSLVFHYDAAGRKARVPTADARALVPRVARGQLGPNVLLRPVVERFLLPTLAYVAGPGEYAYFAQVGAVADALHVPHPIAVPRWSGTIIEPHVRRALARLGAEPDDVADADALAARLARARLPAEASAAVASRRRAVDEQLAALAEVRGVIDPPVIAGARAQITHRIDRLERRLVAAEKRRADDVARDLTTVTAALYPRGVRQERVLNAVPLLARHGPALTEAMLTAARMHAEAVVARGIGAFSV